jgi:hypothetical protein
VVFSADGSLVAYGMTNGEFHVLRANKSVLPFFHFIVLEAQAHLVAVALLLLLLFLLCSLWSLLLALSPCSTNVIAKAPFRSAMMLYP